MCNTTHSHVRYHSFICATCLLLICAHLRRLDRGRLTGILMLHTNSYVQHDSTNHMCDMTHSYVRHDPFICVRTSEDSSEGDSRAASHFTPTMTSELGCPFRFWARRDDSSSNTSTDAMVLRWWCMVPHEKFSKVSATVILLSYLGVSGLYRIGTWWCNIACSPGL